MRITEHIHALKLPFRVPVAPGISLERFAYVYIITGGKEILLVDSGVAGSEEPIFSYLRELGHAPEEIAALVLTHSHPDHLGAAKAIRATAGCPVWAHAAERDWIEDTGKQVRERPVPGFDVLVGGPVTVDRLLEEGKILDLGGITVEVLHTPGHSRGSISLLLREDRALISGDAVPVPGDIPIYDEAGTSIRSVRRLREIPGVDFLLSSWDSPRQGGEIPRLMDESLAWMERIQTAVDAAAEAGVPAGTTEFTRSVMERLGLPLQAANPLVARTFAAHVKER